jgi:hypothetical protein
MEVGFCPLTQPSSAFSVTLVFSDRPIGRSPFLVSDERDPNNHRSVYGISQSITTNATPQRVAASAKRLSSVASGNSNRTANSK